MAGGWGSPFGYEPTDEYVRRQRRYIAFAGPDPAERAREIFASGPAPAPTRFTQTRLPHEAIRDAIMGVNERLEAVPEQATQQEEGGGGGILGTFDKFIGKPLDVVAETATDIAGSAIGAARFSPVEKGLEAIGAPEFAQDIGRRLDPLGPTFRGVGFAEGAETATNLAGRGLEATGLPGGGALRGAIELPNEPVGPISGSIMNLGRGPQGFAERQVEDFRERPMLQQLGAGVMLDPTNLVGASGIARAGAKLSTRAGLPMGARIFNRAAEGIEAAPGAIARGAGREIAGAGVGAGAAAIQGGDTQDIALGAAGGALAGRASRGLPGKLGTPGGLLDNPIGLGMDTRGFGPEDIPGRAAEEAVEEISPGEFARGAERMGLAPRRGPEPKAAITREAQELLERRQFVRPEDMDFQELRDVARRNGLRTTEKTQPQDIITALERLNERSGGVPVDEELAAYFDFIGQIDGSTEPRQIYEEAKERMTQWLRTKKPGDVGVVEPRPLSDWMNAFQVGDAGPFRRLVGRLGNPSARIKSDIERLGYSFLASQVEHEGYVDNIVSPLLPRFRRLFDIDPNTRFLKGISPKEADASLHWNDVFSQPWRYNMTDEQEQFIREYAEVSRQIRPILRKVGVELPEDLPDRLYIPRMVETIRGVTIEGPGNHRLPRHYQDAIAGEMAGIVYSDDPLDTLRASLRTDYRVWRNETFKSEMSLRTLTKEDIIDPSLERRVHAIEALRHDLENVGKEGRLTMKQMKTEIRRGAARASEEAGRRRTSEARQAGRLSGAGEIQERVARSAPERGDEALAAARSDLQQAVRSFDTSAVNSQAELGQIIERVRTAERVMAREASQRAGATRSSRRKLEMGRRWLQRMRERADNQVEMTPEYMKSAADMLRRAERTLGEVLGTERAGARARTSVARATRTPLSQGEELARRGARVAEAAEIADIERRVADLIPDIRTTRGGPPQEVVARALGYVKREEKIAKRALAQAKNSLSNATEVSVDRLHERAAQSRDELNNVLELLGEGGVTNPKTRKRLQDKAVKLADQYTRIVNVIDDLPEGYDSVLLREYQRIGGFASDEAVQSVQRLLDDQLRRHPIAAGFEEAAGVTRTAAAGLDHSSPFIQGLPLLFRMPDRWAAATVRSTRAAFDHDFMASTMERLRPELNEMAQRGILTSADEDYLGLRTVRRAGRALEGRVPGGAAVAKPLDVALSQTYGRAARAYQNFMLLQRVEWWRAAKSSFPDLDEAAAFVRNVTGGQESRMLGVSANQRAWEAGYLAFSPRYMRSTMTVIHDALKGTFSKNIGEALTHTLPGTGLASNRYAESAATMYRLLIGASMGYIGFGLAKGMIEGQDIDETWDEIAQGMNPLNGKRFMSYNINGTWVGVGSQFRSIVQVMTALGEAGLTGDFKSLTSTDLIDNPILNFYASRGAPAMRFLASGLEFMSGGDFVPYENIDTMPKLMEALGTSVLPLSVQGALEGERITGLGSSFIGARTSNQTPTEARNQLRDRLAQDRFGQSYLDLPADQKAEINNLPEVQEAIAAAAEYQADFGGGRGQFVQAQQEARESIRWNSAQVAAGAMSPREWKERYQEITNELRVARDLSGIEQGDDLLSQYFAIYDRFEDPGGGVDYEAAEQALLAFEREHPEVREEIDKWVGAHDDPIAQMYRQYRELAREYYAIPAYLGLNEQESERAREVLGLARDLVAQGVPNRQQALMLALNQGFISEADITLAMRAAGNPNPARRQFKLDNPLVNLFLSDSELITQIDVPEGMRGAAGSGGLSRGLPRGFGSSTFQRGFQRGF